MGKDMVPKRMFFTKGVGKHRERLTSFELALRDAGIAAQNLVRVSSIFPPNCKMLTRKEGVKYLSPGEVVFAVVAENSTHEAHRLLASSIGVAIPADKNTYGYLSEHHSFGETEDAAAIRRRRQARLVDYGDRFGCADFRLDGFYFQRGKCGTVKAFIQRQQTITADVGMGADQEIRKNAARTVIALLASPFGIGLERSTS